MRSRRNGAFLFLVLCTVAGATAQQTRDASAKTHPSSSTDASQPAQPLTSATLTGEEGLAVLGAALKSHPRPSLKSDCSHLVHAIYERAGFPYAYASSTGLYRGIAEFRRVFRPQPGDLVVWPGHVGVAVNPLTIRHIGRSADALTSFVMLRRPRQRYRSPQAALQISSPM